jgi:hypothetical protein
MNDDKEMWPILSNDNTLNIDQKAAVITRLIVKALKEKNDTLLSKLAHNLHIKTDSKIELTERVEGKFTMTDTTTSNNELEIKQKIIDNLKKIDLNEEEKLHLYKALVELQDPYNFARDGSVTFFKLYQNFLIKSLDLQRSQQALKDWLLKNYSKKEPTPTSDAIKNLIETIFEKFQEKTPSMLTLFKMTRIITTWLLPKIESINIDTGEEDSKTKRINEKQFLIQWLVITIFSFLQNKLMEEIKNNDTKHYEAYLNFVKNTTKILEKYIEEIPALEYSEELMSTSGQTLQKSKAARKDIHSVRTDIQISIMICSCFETYILLDESSFSDSLKFLKDLNDDSSIDKIEKELMDCLDPKPSLAIPEEEKKDSPKSEEKKPEAQTDFFSFKAIQARFKRMESVDLTPGSSPTKTGTFPY